MIFIVGFLSKPLPSFRGLFLALLFNEKPLQVCEGYACAPALNIHSHVCMCKSFSISFSFPHPLLVITIAYRKTAAAGGINVKRTCDQTEKIEQKKSFEVNWFRPAELLAVEWQQKKKKQKRKTNLILEKLNSIEHLMDGAVKAFYVERANLS